MKVNLVFSKLKIYCPRGDNSDNFIYQFCHNMTIWFVIFKNPCSWMNSTMYKHGPKIAFLGCKQYAEVFGNAYCPKQNSWVSYIFIHFRVCRQLKWKRRQSSESATQKSSMIYFYSECIEKNDTVNNYTLIINYIGISWILIGFIASVFFFPVFSFIIYHLFIFHNHRLMHFSSLSETTRYRMRRIFQTIIKRKNNKNYISISIDTKSYLKINVSCSGGIFAPKKWQPWEVISFS